MININNEKNLNVQSAPSEAKGAGQKTGTFDLAATLTSLSSVMEEVLVTAKSDKIVPLTSGFNAEESAQYWMGQAHKELTGILSILKENNSEDPNNENLQAAMMKLFQETANWMVDQFKSDSKVAKGLNGTGASEMAAMEALCKKQMDEITEAAEKQAKATWIQKIVGGFMKFLAALGMAVALACGQPGLFVTILAFTIASETGGFTKLAEAIADSLIKTAGPNGLSEKAAKLIADVIVTVIAVVVTAVTAGAGSAGLGQFSASRTLSYAALAATQSLTATNTFGDMMAVACANMPEGKKKELVESIMTIILTILVSLAGAAPMTSLCKGTSGLATALKNAMSSTSSSGVNLTLLIKGIIATQVISTLFQVGFQSAGAAYKVQLSKVMQEQGISQSLIAVLQQLLDTNSQGIQNNSSQSASRMKNLNLALKELIDNAMLPGKALNEQLA
jgi:hypothetical protein